MAGRAKLFENITIQDFDIDPEKGFLPPYEPRPQMPLVYPLAVLAEQGLALPKILASGKIREIFRPGLNHAPKIDLRFLKNNRRALDEAMRYFSFLGPSYVYPVGQKPADAIPSEIAVPWHICAKLLGRPPVLSYASYALTNWFRLDHTKPIELGNIAVAQNFLGGLDEDWFILVHVDIEAKAGPIPDICLSEIKNRASNPSFLGTSLTLISKCQKRMLETMKRMPENCDPYIYYTRVRPYLFGWSERSPLPHGVVYEGVEEYGGKPQKFFGETGAQSCIVPTLYAYLGIEFEKDEFLHYLLEMRKYMPSGHRKFIETLERVNMEQGTLRDFIIDSRSLGWKDDYNDCVDLLAYFLELHWKFAKEYIYDQEEKTAFNPNRTGTGGSMFLEYLKKHIEAVKAHRIP